MNRNAIQNTFAATVCSCVLLLSGCYLPIIDGPPGTIGMQRSRAVLNDPFPSDILAPPIGGARPREFDLPLAEATSYQSHPQARRKRSYAPTGRGGLGGFGAPLQPPPAQQFFPQ